MSRIKHYTEHSIGKKLIYGGCIVSIAAGAFFGGYKAVEHFATKTKYNLDGLPLTETENGAKHFSENRNPNVVITSSFEEEIKKGTEKEQEYLIDALKYAVDQFNSLTSYYKYTLTAESDYFVDLGVQKNTSKNTIPLNLVEQNGKNLATTYLDIKRNGQITKCRIEFDNSYLWMLWDYKDGEQIYEAENSLFVTIVLHEFLHSIGFVDIYDVKLKDETIMYYTLNPKIRNYTEKDRKNCALLEERITGQKIFFDVQENAEFYDNIFCEPCILTKVEYEDEIEK